MTLPVTPQAAFAATLVDEWLRAGVTDAVVAPGSRSTPLALAVDEAGLRVHVHLDERAAGFYALGVAMASGRPAPVVVTSGTAAAELVPAVVEAHHSRVPMIVCTADRPPELHHVGAPQTIEQGQLYHGLLRWHADLGAAGDLPPEAWRSIAARSVVASLGGPCGPGPVQLNLGWRDPLVGVPGDLVPAGRSQDRPWHHRASPTGAAGEVPGLIALMSGRPGAIVAGAGPSDPDPILQLARALGWPVLAAPGSGCRGRSTEGVVVSAFDAILRHGPTAARLAPAVVLRLGTPPASKVLAQWLGGLPADQVVADPHGAWVDPERTATMVVTADAEALCRSVLAGGAEPAPAGWAPAWQAAERAAQQAIDTALARFGEITEPGVARAVTAALPVGATLVVASSMPIRDVEWFGAPSMRCRVLANRGANGIDGMVSTSLGVAAGVGRVPPPPAALAAAPPAVASVPTGDALPGAPVVALLGDLAFLHDGGGLLGASRRDLSCTFVVIDNRGGGIFGFLPQASQVPAERFERLFGTPHDVDLAALAAVHGIRATVVAEAEAVGPAVAAAVEAGGVRLVLVRTRRDVNVAVHAELGQAVEEALTALA